MSRSTAKVILGQVLSIATFKKNITIKCHIYHHSIIKCNTLSKKLAHKYNFNIKLLASKSASLLALRKEMFRGPSGSADLTCNHSLSLLYWFNSHSAMLKTCPNTTLAFECGLKLQCCLCRFKDVDVKQFHKNNM